MKCRKCKIDKKESEFGKFELSSVREKKYCKKCIVAFSSNSRRLKEYGIGTKEYNELVVKQEGKCLICGIHQNNLGKTLSVDHNHSTKEIRGLLCNSCNLGLGYFKDNLINLMRAIKYLNPLIVNYKISDFLK